MISLALRNLIRRPARTCLTAAGVAIAVSVLTTLWSFGHGYERALGAELDRMGLQLMLVPLGCPYDAAARVLKGNPLENSLPEEALKEARHDPAVAVAAPLLMAALPRPAQGRADLWVGLDETSLALKPWWCAAAGQGWFTSPDSVILGVDAAEIEMRAPGDPFFSPETGKRLQVDGVLERSGTSDDSLFFVPLRTAQAMFKQPGRLTAVAIRLRDPSLLRQAAGRLQRIPGAQVVTATEMMGTFLNLVGAARSLLLSISLLALAISGLSVFNTLLGTVFERSNELAVMRAVGASRVQVAALIAIEGLLLACLGSVLGLAVAWVAGQGMENVVKQFVPFAPAAPLLRPNGLIVAQAVALGAAVGVLGGIYPAWRAAGFAPAEGLKGD
jgi:putative ABC transport system permease protein